jgi:hypothetical protein
VSRLQIAESAPRRPGKQTFAYFVNRVTADFPFWEPLKSWARRSRRNFGEEARFC